MRIIVDQWGFGLGFYRSDYVSGGGTRWFTSLDNTFSDAQIKDIFNGNIAYQVILNGNLLALNRNGVGGAIDELTYAYRRTGGQLDHNRLYHVNDAVGFQNANDLDDQGIYSIPLGQTNYRYDATGNLIRDVKEQTSNIVWDHLGKIDFVDRDAGSGKARLWFDYDALGNRVKKTTWAEGSSDPTDRVSQFYLRDPQGNVLAIYALTREDGNEVLTLKEQHIYGSQRLGLQARDLVLYNLPAGTGVPESGSTAVVDGGEKGIVVTELWARSPLGDTDLGKMVILGNMTARRIKLDDLTLANTGSGQGFVLPSGTALDSAERLVVAYGSDTLQDGIVDLLNWPTDSTLQWVWQTDFVLSDSGRLTVSGWDASASVALERIGYGSEVVRERIAFAGRDAVVAEGDFAGGPATERPTERRSIRFGLGEQYAFAQLRGAKRYELSDHLGNVAVVVSDRKVAQDDDADLGVDWFAGEVLSARDFYPFGFGMFAGRNSAANAPFEGYRYGFQGQETDDEWIGSQNAVAFKYRMHNARLGRFLSVDPLAPDYPGNSGYAFSENRVIDGFELEGLERFTVHLREINDLNDITIDQSKADFIAYEISFSIIYPDGSESVLETDNNIKYIFFENKTFQEGNKSPNALAPGRTYDLEQKGFTSPSGYVFSKDWTIHIKSERKGHSDRTYIHPSATTGQGFLAGCKSIAAEHRIVMSNDCSTLYVSGEFARDRRRLAGTSDYQHYQAGWNASRSAMVKVIRMYERLLEGGHLQDSENFRLKVGSTAQDRAPKNIDDSPEINQDNDEEN